MTGILRYSRRFKAFALALWVGCHVLFCAAKSQNAWKRTNWGAAGIESQTLGWDAFAYDCAVRSKTQTQRTFCLLSLQRISIVVNSEDYECNALVLFRVQTHREFQFNISPIPVLFCSLDVSTIWQLIQNSINFSYFSD